MDAVGYGLYLGESGDLGLWLGGGSGLVERIYTRQPLRRAEWYFVAASFDAAKGEARLYQTPVLNFPNDPSSVVVERQARSAAPTDAPLLIAAAYVETVKPGRLVGRGIFNGKIDGPRVFARALLPNEIDQLRRGISPEAVAEWDFAADIGSSRVTDRGRHQLHGIAVNMPGRAATGHNWTGSEVDFKRAPSEYGAMYFHDDDLDDARWDVDFELTVPDTWKSGSTRRGSRLKTRKTPFRSTSARTRESRALTLYLAPTMTYPAYGNYRTKDVSHDESARCANRSAAAGRIWPSTPNSPCRCTTSTATGAGAAIRRACAPLSTCVRRFAGHWGCAISPPTCT
jgi:N,N-dimethylformamidase